MSKGFITGTNEELIKAYKESRDESYLKELIEANKGLINLLVSPYLTSIPSTYFPDPQGLLKFDWKYVGARYSDGDYMDPYDKESWELTGAKMVVVDGEKIKEDTYYRCIEGEIVEVTEDGEIVEE